MLYRPRCMPSRFNRNDTGVLLYDKLVKVMVNLETREPDLRLAGLFAYFRRKAAGSQFPFQWFYLTANVIEADLGLSGYLVNKFCEWMEVAGLLRYWLTRKMVKDKLVRCYALETRVLDPIVDGLVPWPVNETVEAYQHAIKTYGIEPKSPDGFSKEKQLFLEDVWDQSDYVAPDDFKRMILAVRCHYAIRDYTVARIYAAARPSRYVEKRLSQGFVFADAPMAVPLRMATDPIPSIRRLTAKESLDEAFADP